jgi:CRISPR system Cascade subunit CasC
MNPGIAYLDLHVLQTVPPSCLNRDDTNSPKTAVYGGVRRARVSSQSWKRATRLRFNASLPKDALGTRTRKLPDLIRDRVAVLVPDADAERVAHVSARAAGAMIGMDDKAVKKMLDADDPSRLPYALFLPMTVVAAAADHVADAVASGKEPDAEKLRALLNGREGHTLDIALFGRMVATSPDLNVDAACQVAHAVSTHAVNQEFDFFTTVDDVAAAVDETGAAMMGYVEFASATLYRYATVNVSALADNLGGPDPVPASCRLFAEAFARSLPTGKQNTFAAHNPPDVVLAVLRTDQPVSLVGAFENPVRGQDGYVSESASRLAAHAAALDDAYGVPRAGGWHTATPAAGDLSGPLAGSSMPFPALLDAVEQAVTAAMAARC